MNRWLLFLLALFPLLLGLRRDVDLYDFKDQKKVCRWEYENIDLEELVLNGAKEKKIELSVKDACNLKKMVISTLFGTLSGYLKGDVSCLQSIEIQGGSTALTLDLTASFPDFCTLKISGGEGNHSLVLPKNCSVSVEIKSSKVKLNAPTYEKTGWFTKQLTRKGDQNKELKVLITDMKGSLDLN